MTLSMYQTAVPVTVRALENLAHVLKKGTDHAAVKSVTDQTLLQTRLITDMLPLVKQVQIATDTAKNGLARLAAVEPMKIEDDETTFEQLQARIARVIEYIKSFKPEQIDGSEERAVTLKTAGGEVQFKGQTYLLHFVIPNLYFHCATAYNILRESGAELGKKDFLGNA